MMKFVVVSLLIAFTSAFPDLSVLPSGGYLPTVRNDFVGGSGFGTGQIHDKRHIYFFAAPGDEHQSRLRINVVPSSHKNTKLIFIKAPSYGTLIPEVNAVNSLAEDKTLVYVLVKKPEHGGAINIPAGLGVNQAKPEVYFLKYNTQQDASSKITGTLSGQHVGAQVPDVGNESGFISVLDSGVHHDNVGVIGESGPY